MATTIDTITGTSLTAHEKRVVMTHRLGWFLWEGQFGVHRAASTAKWLVLTGGDAGLMAQFMGTAWSINSLLNLFINPVSGAVSDSYKRGPVIAFARLGLCAYFVGQWAAKTPIQMVIADNLGWGILSAGGLAVQGAALDDMFGDRPELNSAINSSCKSVAGISGSLGPLVGILFWNKGWSNAAFLLPAAMLVAQAGLFFTCPETLKPEKRVPFSASSVISSANVFANLGLLFTNGSALRKLSIASFFYHGCTSTWSTLEAYRSQAIGWSPPFALGFDSAFFLSTAFGTAMVVPRLIARWGNPRLFTIWCVCTFVFPEMESSNCAALLIGDALHLATM
jgi:Na+/melibiose symporter-like transporter